MQGQTFSVNNTAFDSLHVDFQKSEQDEILNHIMLSSYSHLWLPSGFLLQFLIVRHYQYNPDSLALCT
jgi:hypothetical protein